MENELEKCKSDIVYFTEKYYKATDNNGNVIPIILAPHQKNLLRKYGNKKA